VILAIVAFFFIIRPLMNKLKKVEWETIALPGVQREALPEGTGYPALTDKQNEKPLSLRQHSIALVRENPEHATAIIRAMLREEI
jgi:flagellar biosynthesis/type III secretory pathway M-ring protein FliF/YscJ